MFKLGLIGCPLGHSLSPSMHNAALKELGAEGSYVLLETLPENLGERVESLKEDGFKGFNITIPYKVDIISYLDSTDNFAKAVGAVNTVVIDENKKLHGYNTDVYGFISAVPREYREILKSGKAAILGSGGAARAISAGLTELGVKEINIFAVDREEALTLKELILKTRSDVSIECFNLVPEISLKDFSVVVNATPVGMQGKYEGVSPINEASVATLPDNALVYDIVYKPKRTKLLEIAEKRALKTLSGLEMLLLQGVKGFELWTGKKAPVDKMREVLLYNVQKK